MQNHWEVEQKYVVLDAKAFTLQLTQCGFSKAETDDQMDLYFRHPCRDFRATDEAFRLRRINEQLVVTYKGKRLGGTVKVRPEIELPLGADDYDGWVSMLTQLGFEPLPEVRKHRTTYRQAAGSEAAGSEAAGATLIVTFDRVERLGNFAEIEQVVSCQDEIPQAERDIHLLAEQLGLERTQPRSYLAQLLSLLGIE